MAKRYLVTYEKDEAGWWVATVEGVAGVHTQARSIAQARKRIREALATVVDKVEKAQLVDRVKLAPEIKRAIKALTEARSRVETEQKRAQARAAEVARLLTARMSVRDAGEVLGLSHQRVQQLVGEHR